MTEVKSQFEWNVFGVKKFHNLAANNATNLFVSPAFYPSKCASLLGSRFGIRFSRASPPAPKCSTNQKLAVDTSQAPGNRSSRSSGISASTNDNVEVTVRVTTPNPVVVNFSLFTLVNHEQKNPGKTGDLSTVTSGSSSKLSNRPYKMVVSNFVHNFCSGVWTPDFPLGPLHKLVDSRADSLTVRVTIHNCTPAPMPALNSPSDGTIIRDEPPRTTPEISSASGEKWSRWQRNCATPLSTASTSYDTTHCVCNDYSADKVKNGFNNSCRCRDSVDRRRSSMAVAAVANPLRPRFLSSMETPSRFNQEWLGDVPNMSQGSNQSSDSKCLGPILTEAETAHLLSIYLNEACDDSAASFLPQSKKDEGRERLLSMPGLDSNLIDSPFDINVDYQRSGLSPDQSGWKSREAPRDRGYTECVQAPSRIHQPVMPPPGYSIPGQTTLPEDEMYELQSKLDEIISHPAQLRALQRLNLVAALAKFGGASVPDLNLQGVVDTFNRGINKQTPPLASPSQEMRPPNRPRLLSASPTGLQFDDPSQASLRSLLASATCDSPSARPRTMSENIDCRPQSPDFTSSHRTAKGISGLQGSALPSLSNLAGTQNLMSSLFGSHDLAENPACLTPPNGNLWLGYSGFEENCPPQRWHGGQQF